MHYIALQRQQEVPQDVYAQVFDESELESLYDALRRQREGLEYITEILTYVLNSCNAQAAWACRHFTISSMLSAPTVV